MLEQGTGASERLAGQDTVRRRRLNAICPYYTMYPLDFPLAVLREAMPDEWVLDPFCGRGTTNFAARLYGLPTVGVDVSPIAVAIAQAKLVDVSAEAVASLCAEILATEPDAEVPEGEFWTLAYHPETLADVCRLRARLLRRCEQPAEIALRALVLGILHGPLNKGRPTYLSNQMPRTYATKPDAAVRFWRSRGLMPPRVDVLDAVTRRAKHVFAERPDQVPGCIIRADSRKLDSVLPFAAAAQPFTAEAVAPGEGGSAATPDSVAGYAGRSAELSAVPKFRWVITSPPYYGMRTYVPDHWLRNWFLGGPPTVDYSGEGQLGGASLTDFVDGLRQVWMGVASACAAGARLVVRYGALPSKATDALALLRASLEGTPWRERGVREAGSAADGKRQADQFGCVRSRAVGEVDLFAVLDA